MEFDPRYEINTVEVFIWITRNVAHFKMLLSAVLITLSPNLEFL